MTKLFNAATGIPEKLIQRVAGLRLNLHWTRHAKQQAVEDKYGVLPPGAYPERFCWEQSWSLVEVETDDRHRITKFVVRRPADANRSIVLVIRPDDFAPSGRVVTMFLNLNTDTHKSLDTTKFAKV